MYTSPLMMYSWIPVQVSGTLSLKLCLTCSQQSCYVMFEKLP